MKNVIFGLKKNWKQILLVVILVLGIGYVFEVSETKIDKKESNEVKSEIIDNKSFEYKGEEGKDALSLLKEKTLVELNDKGMVVSVDGRKADSEAHEFWGFYVNGKMAEVGAADFKTKDTDVINWKIERY